MTNELDDEHDLSGIRIIIYQKFRVCSKCGNRIWNCALEVIIASAKQLCIQKVTISSNATKKFY